VALDTNIDDLYRLPLGDFTASRNALAKALTGADAKRVRALAKPTVVPWAVNQVYWRARATYDRLLKSGERLRAAQIAALEGRAADVRAASEAHRRAIAEAVKEAERLAKDGGSAPDADALARTFEALSVAATPPESPGRLTQPLRPAGFEALAGVTPQPSERRSPEGSRYTATKPPTKQDLARERAAAEAARRREADLKKAEAAVARAAAVEHEARAAWERAHDALLAARSALSNLKSAI
jgi:hypothetical protein